MNILLDSMASGQSAAMHASYGPWFSTLARIFFLLTIIKYPHGLFLWTSQRLFDPSPFTGLLFHVKYYALCVTYMW